MIVKEEVVGRNGGEVCESGEDKMSSQQRGDEAFEGNACALGIGFPLQQRQLVVVGYALTSKKTKSFLQPKLEGLARNKGIVFVPIDQNRPLSDQGPFDIVLHKLLGKEWRQILESFSLHFVPSLIMTS